MTVGDVASRLHAMSTADIRRIEKYEKQHKNRSTLLKKLEQARSAG
jgi:hypothetical protein